MKLTNVIILAAMVLATPVIASAQHGHEQHEQHSHVKPDHGGRGHANHEGHVRHFDENYRHEHFGHEHRCGFRELGWANGRFFFGGVYWNLTVFPDLWIESDMVYVDFVDGDYFLYNERLHTRVAIVLYE